jgi:glycosyltransferase involved in cell wall biosynthesis
MRILFLIKSLALSGGGAERVLSLISTGLADRGHVVNVLTFDGPESSDFHATGELVSRTFLGLGNPQKRSGPLVTMRRILAIREEVRRFGPDVAIGFMHSAFFPLSLALSNSGIPVIGSERTSYDHYRSRPVERFLVRLSAPRLAAMTVNDEQVRRGFPAPLAKRMTVVPNPVLKARALADPIGPRAKTLLSVGGLRAEKDHSTLLLAFARIAGRFSDWKLRIIGDGPLIESLRRQIAALGLEHRVELPGASPRVDEEYEGAQLFVLPSIYEAFPNSVAEALAHGLPSIGFADCPGTNALIIPGENGDLAEGGDRVAGLAKSLARLMNDASLRSSLGEAAPRSMERYSLGAAVDRWEQLLEQVASR